MCLRVVQRCLNSDLREVMVCLTTWPKEVMVCLTTWPKEVMGCLTTSPKLVLVQLSQHRLTSEPTAQRCYKRAISQLYQEKRVLQLCRTLSPLIRSLRRRAWRDSSGSGGSLGLRKPATKCSDHA